MTGLLSIINRADLDALILGSASEKGGFFRIYGTGGSLRFLIDNYDVKTGVDIIPKDDNIQNLGASNKKWANILVYKIFMSDKLVIGEEGELADLTALEIGSEYGEGGDLIVWDDWGEQKFWVDADGNIHYWGTTDCGGDLIPIFNNAYNLGTSGYRWKHCYLRGYLGLGRVTSLPTPSATYRGILIRVQGGTGVEDILYECKKKADESYEWIKLLSQLDIPFDHATEVTNVQPDQHADTKVRTKEVDEVNIADGRTLVYRTASGKLEYEDFPAAGPHDLPSHTDVEITTPSDNEVLTYEAATAKWKNKPGGAGGGITKIETFHDFGLEEESYTGA